MIKRDDLDFLPISRGEKRRAQLKKSFEKFVKKCLGNYFPKLITEGIHMWMKVCLCGRSGVYLFELGLALEAASAGQGLWKG